MAAFSVEKNSVIPSPNALTQYSISSMYPIHTHLLFSYQKALGEIQSNPNSQKRLTTFTVINDKGPKASHLLSTYYMPGTRLNVLKIPS